MKSKFPTRFTVLATLVFTASIPVEAATITFIGGNTVWTDNANTANWSPADEPDLDDDVIFNTANTVPLGSSNSVKSLALSGGISLSTTDFDISVDGLLQLSGAGTDLTVGGSASVVSPDSVTLNSGGEILFNGGSLTMVEETGNGLFDINAGAGISGFGTINLSDGLSAVTTLMSNSGTISASTGNILAVVPPAGTLAINAASVANARLDLDANAPITSVVNVFRNQTLDINVTLADAYSGDMNLFHNSTIDVSTPWSIDAGATVDIVNGFDDNGLLLDIPASTSFINGAAFTQTGGTITVVDTDGTLQFNSAFTQSGGNLVNNGKVVFNANTTIAAGANFTMPGTSSSLTVNPGVVVNVDQADFNSDGSGTSSNIINIGSGGTLNLGLGTGADETLSGAIALNGGTLSVTTIDNTWSVDGSISVGASTGTSQINGDPVTLTSVPVTVGAGSVLVFGATSVLDAAASFSIGNGARVDLGPTTFSNPGTITGAGTLRVGSTSTTAETTVIGVHTFDWDGTGVGSLQTINPGVTLAITSPVFDDDGDMDDPVSLGGNGGKLSVDGPSSWLMKNTFTANNGNVGTSTIGGFSRMVLSGATGLFNINGTTTVTSPFTFGGGSTSTLAAGATLSMQGNTFYDGGNITGAGNLQPGVSTVNSVVVPGVETTSSITTANLNFDLGTWTLNSNSHLIVDVGDYDSDTPANSFGGVITMDGATLTVRSSDSSFIMVGEMNMRGPGTGTAGIHPFAEYTADSDPIIFGDDGPTPNAFLNIGGADLSVIHTPATFMSDAIVNITSPATLLLSGSATFNSVNGAGNAQFTGNGKLLMGGNVTFNEATTLNMPGGRIGLDEGGATAHLVNIFGPLVINTGVLEDFGASPFSGNNTLHIEKVSGIVNGSLTVNLDNPAAEWTLQSSGRLDLTTDGTGSPTLLSGSPVNLNGTVNVSGPVETAARVDIGGTVNINPGNAGIPFFLAGGNNTTAPNTLAGGTITGAGFLGSQGARALVGFGTINCLVNFGVVAPSTVKSDLLADNGELVITNDVQARILGTADSDGILNVVPAWNSVGIDQIRLNGGVLKGGTFNIANTAGLTGHGLVTAKIINTRSIMADSSSGPLIIQTAANDNDWDGSFGSGSLIGVSTLEIRDNATFNFTGTVGANTGGTVYANGFELDMSAATLNLSSGGTFRQSGGLQTDLGGTILIGSGFSNLRVTDPTGGFLFESTANATLTGFLQLDCPDTVIQAGATFSGAGRLVNFATRRLSPNDLANINVFVENRGILSPGANTVARNDVRDFKQTSTGVLSMNLNGASLGSFDRLQVNGSAEIAGNLELTLSGYVPAINDTLTLLTTTGSVSGTFASVIQPAGMPPGRVFQVIYNSSNVQVKVVASSPFDAWINSFALITNPADRTKAANPDGDELNNLGEFALDGNPASGVSSGKIVGKIAPVSGVRTLTLTIPVRTGCINDPADPAGGELVLKQAADSLFYHIQATDDFASYPLTVTEVTGSDAVAIQAGLPPLSSGWIYRTFRSPGGVAGDPLEFMRVTISE